MLVSLQRGQALRQISESIQLVGDAVAAGFEQLVRGDVGAHVPELFDLGLVVEREYGAFGRRHGEPERILWRRGAERCHRAPQRITIARKRDEEVDVAVTVDQRHREVVARLRVRQILLGSAPRPQHGDHAGVGHIEREHVQPALPRIAQLFVGQGREVDDVEVVDRLRLPVDAQREVIARKSAHGRAVFGDGDRHLDDFDRGPFARLRRGGNDDGEESENGGKEHAGETHQKILLGRCDAQTRVSVPHVRAAAFGKCATIGRAVAIERVL